jgi:hypothetical protein
MTLWGIVLNGERVDLEDWAWTFKPPLDPHIVWTHEDSVRHAVLKAAAFDGLRKSDEVYERAGPLIERLEGIMLLAGYPTTVSPGATAEFRSDGSVGYHYYLKPVPLIVGRPNRTTNAHRAGC